MKKNMTNANRIASGVKGSNKVSLNEECLNFKFNEGELNARRKLINAQAKLDEITMEQYDYSADDTANAIIAAFAEIDECERTLKIVRKSMKWLNEPATATTKAEETDAE